MYRVCVRDTVHLLLYFVILQIQFPSALTDWVGLSKENKVTSDQRVYELLERANKFLLIGAPEAAVELFQSAKKLDPHSEKVRNGAVVAKELATILSDAVLAGVEHPVNFNKVR